MATIKEQTEKTERLKTSLDNKVNSIGNIINTKVKEKPTTLTQVDDVLNRKMLGIGDTLTDVQVLDLGYPSDKNGIFPGNTGRIYALAIDDTYIYSGSDDNAVRKIRKSDMVEVGIFTGNTSYVKALAVDNEFIYSSSYDKIVREIRKSDMVEVGKFTGHINYVNALAIDDTYIYSGSDDRIVRKIRKSDMTEIYRFIGHNYPVNALAIDNEYIYSGGNDRTVRKWFKYMLYKIISI